MRAGRRPDSSAKAVRHPACVFQANLISGNTTDSSVTGRVRVAARFGTGSAANSRIAADLGPVLVVPTRRRCAALPIERGDAARTAETCAFKFLPSWHCRPGPARSTGPGAMPDPFGRSDAACTGNRRDRPVRSAGANAPSCPWCRSDRNVPRRRPHAGGP